MPRARECVISKQVPKRGHAPLAQRRHQRGDRKLSGPGSPTGMKHQNLAGHYNSRLRHDTLKMPLEGRSRAQVPAVRSLCRGVRASMLRRATNPACGSANLHWDSLRGISSQACLFQFLFVVSRQGRGRCSPTGMKHQNLAGHYNSRLRHDTLKMPLEGRSRAEWHCSATVPNSKSLGHMTLSGLSASTKPS